MSRGNWNRIKQSKAFYVNTYRRVMAGIVFSLAVNIILFVAIVYVYKSRQLPTFYATSGMTPPIELKALDAPNDTSEPLLPPDPTDDNEVKLIPD